MKRYKAKKYKNYWALIPILWINIIGIYKDFPWLAFMFFNTSGVAMFLGLNKIRNSVEYFILGEILVVKTLFTTTSIDIKTIRKLEANRSFLKTRKDNATAPSHDALEIHYQRFETLMISPEDKNELIRDLLAINPQIQVKV